MPIHLPATRLGIATVPDSTRRHRLHAENPVPRRDALIVSVRALLALRDCAEDPPACLCAARRQVIERILNHLASKDLPGLWTESRVPKQANDGKFGVLRRSIGYDRGESGVSSYCRLQAGSNAGWAWLRIPMEFSK